MKMSLQQLETFYWIARLGGFHAAARHLHLTQPTISARIQELEDTLGVRLIERGRQRIEITPAGRDVLAQAEKMLRLADELENLRNRRDPMRGLLRLGANESTAMSGLLELLAQLDKQYPDLRIELTIDVGAALSRRLNARELDVAILSDPISAPHVIDEAIGMADFQWVASSRLALPRGDFTPADIAGRRIVVTPAPSTLYQVADEWFRSADCEPENLGTCNSMLVMTKLVAAGHAVSVLPVSVVRAEIDAGIIRTLPVKPAIAPRPYYVSYLREEQKLGGGIIVRMAREILMQSGLLMPL
ncbi:LysR family transcriptional regulator [Noviherbaspirillum cavernae]|uniref:LysR family transcriptional regulator n=1 Tax=Noviherbaspirillum cavernae TaxID=2320862 RepID=A0A418WYL1_9BURK|nr:LysR family transcriptional regulator [Noviherbaspirillum cavernae]RJG05306.1 LysR family transcriptional regulator [Noviherbaspirillum cavernae]